VAGIIVGLALQDSMSNLAAGLFILIYRPYDVEDIVSAGGIVGTVRAMGLANTTIVTFDNRVLFVPNRKIWSEVIENRSAEQTRRVETTVRISYHADLDGALNLLKDIAKTHEKILEAPAPSAYVCKLADSWIEVRVWCWVVTDDWWSMTTELPRLIRLRFQAEGIEVPYPRHIEERITADAENG
jgi:small conductance mechanosensitive channel